MEEVEAEEADNYWVEFKDKLEGSIDDKDDVIIEGVELADEEIKLFDKLEDEDTKLADGVDDTDNGADDKLTYCDCTEDAGATIFPPFVVDAFTTKDTKVKEFNELLLLVEFTKTDPMFTLLVLSVLIYLVGKMVEELTTAGEI